MLYEEVQPLILLGFGYLMLQIYTHKRAMLMAGPPDPIEIPNIVLTELPRNRKKNLVKIMKKVDKDMRTVKNIIVETDKIKQKIIKGVKAAKEPEPAPVPIPVPVKPVIAPEPTPKPADPQPQPTDPSLDDSQPSAYDDALDDSINKSSQAKSTDNELNQSAQKRLNDNKSTELPENPTNSNATSSQQPNPTEQPELESSRKSDGFALTNWN